MPCGVIGTLHLIKTVLTSQADRKARRYKYHTDSVSDGMRSHRYVAFNKGSINDGSFLPLVIKFDTISLADT